MIEFPSQAAWDDRGKTMQVMTAADHPWDVFGPERATTLTARVLLRELTDASLLEVARGGSGQSSRSAGNRSWTVIDQVAGL